MENWIKHLTLKSEKKEMQCGTFNVRTGIFQGDSSSVIDSLWFSLALNYLSSNNDAGYGSEIKYQRGIHVLSHSVYMDDFCW